jgi:hypothetical protein
VQAAGWRAFEAVRKRYEQRDRLDGVRKSREFYRDVR